jgi:hypothetical protein
MNNLDEIRRQNERACQGIMPPIINRIPMRNEPPVAEQFDNAKPLPNIETERTFPNE